MKSNRKHWSVADKLNVLVRQATCPLCGKKIGRLVDCDFDHETALVLGGGDSIDNLRAVHRDCHKVKTFGNGATTAGGDIHAMAHGRRLTEKQETLRKVMLAKEPGKPRAKTGKIPSRPFPKRRKSI
jgi:hypothetical protein